MRDIPSLHALANDLAGGIRVFAGTVDDPFYIDLGAAFPANNIAAVYELTLFCKPNGDEVGYRARRLDTGDTVQGTLTTKLPAKSTLLCFHAYMNNGGTAAAVTLDLMRKYLESDY